ncbi:MAG: VPLPA-CTERM sorting domain-containing protein [Pseudomonadota bacterium]
MKKLFIFLWAMLLVMEISVNSQAALIDLQNSSGHVVYDDQSGKYWMWDLSAYTNMTYDEQISAISNMNAPGDLYYGLDAWHIADGADLAIFSNYPAEAFEIFNPTWIDGNGNMSWLGRVGGDGGGNDHVSIGVNYNDINGAYNIGIDIVSDDGSYELLGAWVTTSVPIPGAIWLLGSGLIGLVGFRRIKLRKSL